jgi:hypothetical protein
MVEGDKVLRDVAYTVGASPLTNISINFTNAAAGAVLAREV